jgi:hypothetical protein
MVRILTFESPDKNHHIIETIPFNKAVKVIETDHGWIEVIDAYDQNNMVRPYFDIDFGGPITQSETEVLNPILAALNTIFGTTTQDWAISNGSRDLTSTTRKISYHVVSKRHCITLQNLRTISYALNDKFPALDYTLLCISMQATHELLFFRLPNQHKNAVNKSGPPMTVIQGTLADFFVTEIDGLTTFIPQLPLTI